MSSAEELAAEYEKGEMEVSKGSGKRSKVYVSSRVRVSLSAS